MKATDKTNEMTEAKQFAADLRRNLFLAAIAHYNLTDFLQSSVVALPKMKGVKQGIKNVIREIDFMQKQIMLTTIPETWDAIKADLNSEYMHDLNLHIDCVMDVKNLAQITDILNEHKIAEHELTN